uniref:F-box domain-containing protein n=1 Tax=Acrobeloides nanus TaxID=290746 RepID=A0A914DF82_9BILA
MCVCLLELMMVYEPVYRLERLRKLFEDCIHVRRFSLTLNDPDFVDVITSESLQFSTSAEEFNLTYLGHPNEPPIHANVLLNFLADSKIQVASRKYAKFRGLMIDELNFCERFVGLFENAESPENLFQAVEIKATRDQVIAAEWYLEGKFNALFSSSVPGVPSGYIAYQVMRNDFWTLRVMYHSKLMDKFIFSIL